MTIFTVGEFKAHFSEVINRIRRGEEIVIAYGKKKTKIAALVPYPTYQRRRQKRRLGVLQSKTAYCFKDDFAMTDEEFLKA